MNGKGWRNKGHSEEKSQVNQMMTKHNRFDWRIGVIINRLILMRKQGKVGKSVQTLFAFVFQAKQLNWWKTSLPSKMDANSLCLCEKFLWHIIMWMRVRKNNFACVSAGAVHNNEWSNKEHLFSTHKERKDSIKLESEMQLIQWS